MKNTIARNPLPRSCDPVNSMNCNVWLLGVRHFGIVPQGFNYCPFLPSLKRDSVVYVSECVHGYVFVFKE